MGGSSDAARFGAQDFIEKTLASKLDAHVETAESVHDPGRLVESRGAQAQPTQSVDIEPQNSLERPQCSPVDRQDPLPGSRTTSAQDPSFSDMKPQRGTSDGFGGAANAVAQLGSEPEGIESPQFKERPQPSIRLGLTDGSESLQCKPEQAPSLVGRAPFGGKAVEEFEQIASQCKAARALPKAQLGRDELRLLEVSHPPRAAPVQLNPKVIEEIQCAGEPLHAAARTLGNRGQAAGFRREQVDDPVRFAKIDDPKHQAFSLLARHLSSLAATFREWRPGLPDPRAWGSDLLLRVEKANRILPQDGFDGILGEPVEGVPSRDDRKTERCEGSQ